MGSRYEPLRFSPVITQEETECPTCGIRLEVCPAEVGLSQGRGEPCHPPYPPPSGVWWGRGVLPEDGGDKPPCCPQPRACTAQRSAGDAVCSCVRLLVEPRVLPGWAPPNAVGSRAWTKPLYFQ